MRLACLHVPDFPLAAWLRAEPELRGAAVAIADGTTPRARLVAVSASAQQRGIAVGHSAAQALAIASDLTMRAASADAERAAHAALGDVAYSFSPRVEDGRRARCGSTPTASASCIPTSTISRRRRCAAPPPSGSRRRSASPAARSPPSWRRATAAAARWCRRATSGGCWRRCRSISCRRRRRCARR
jgi:hypothetical protein